MAKALQAAAQADRENTNKLRQEHREVERAAALAEIDRKRKLEESKHRATELKRKALAESRESREAAETIRRQGQERKAAARWLQASFPLAVAARIETWLSTLAPSARDQLHAAMKHVLETHGCDRTTVIPELWEDDVRLTRAIGRVALSGDRSLPVRAPEDFEWLLFGGAWSAERSRLADPAAMLQRMMQGLVPGSPLLFQRRYTMPGLVAYNGGNVAKAFVMAVMILSKWLGESVFPVGLHVWPPPYDDVTVVAAVA